MTEPSENKWVHEQLRNAYCYCYFGEDGLMSVHDLLTLPLGTCIDTTKLMEDGWVNVEDLPAKEIDLISNSGKGHTWARC